MMKETAMGGSLLRLLPCHHHPTLSSSSSSSSLGCSPFPSSRFRFRNPNSPPSPIHHGFFPCPSATATPTVPPLPFSPSSSAFKYGRNSTFPRSTRTDMAEPKSESEPEPETGSVDCVGTGSDVECVVAAAATADSQRSSSKSGSWWDWVVLVSPFFFWGTAMVAMKPVLPKTGPLFVSAFRLIPAGLLLVAFAASRRRRPPSGLQAWFSISLFALVDASCFQGFLAEGLQRTPAGLGSVCSLIDPLP